MDGRLGCGCGWVVKLQYGSWLVGGKNEWNGGGLVEMRNSLFFFIFSFFFSQRAPFAGSGMIPVGKK